MDYQIEIDRADSFAQELREKYPLLYQRKVWVEYSYGWYDLIRNLSAEIYELYNKWGSKYTEFPYVMQMKEKFGGLRYYISYGEMEEEDFKLIREIVDKYERLSFSICEQCSQPGKNGTGAYDYWYRTLCEPCRAKRDEEKEKESALLKK